jgi:hypothetical protein
VYADHVAFVRWMRDTPLGQALILIVAQFVKAIRRSCIGEVRTR